MSSSLRDEIASIVHEHDPSGPGLGDSAQEIADRILAIPRLRELDLASQLLRDTDEDVIQIEVGGRRWLCRARSSIPSISTHSDTDSGR